MSAFFEGRSSDSPYIHMIWRGYVEKDYSPVCPADVRWNMLLTRRDGGVRVTVEGPTTHSILKNQTEGSEFLVIRFALGAFIPFLPVGDFVNGDQLLPGASSRTFLLNGSAWQFPDFENVETFVQRLVRDDIVRVDPVVKTVLQEQLPYLSLRTVRRRFLRVTGLTPKAIQQIERAHHAVTLLENGTPIADAVYQAGYADQPHMTRSLRRFIGQTPAQITQEPQTL